MRFIEHFIKSIRQASVYNSDVQVAPACILWPDSDKQWEAVIPHLQNELPELFVLGDYDPEKRTGPAIWLRCVIAGKADDVNLQSDKIPIFYMPGFSRQDLRAVESCPDQLKPMAALQYLGVIWSQVNAKDWTILAFLKSDQGGLGLDVALDNDTKNAMQMALNPLLDEEVELLKGKRLDKDHFNTLLTGGDPVRDLLQWLDHEETFHAEHGKNEWKAFVDICKSQFAFNPEKDGILIGASKLAYHEGPWNPVWDRYREAPKRYPNIPVQIRRCKPPTGTLQWYARESKFDGWPQWNENNEDKLRIALGTLSGLPPHEVRKKLSEFENEHKSRRIMVWAELSEAPLALAMEYLSVLASSTTTPLAAGTIEDLMAGYMNAGWKADDAVMKTLACVESEEDFEVVKKVIQSIYTPWAEDSARYLQKVVEKSGYPGGSASSCKTPHYKDGECVLFVDGLRFDTAKRLVEMLTSQGYKVDEKTAWAALPSITATGKPAVTPVKDKIKGEDTNTDFEPCVAETGQSLKGGYHLKKLLTDAGWEILERSSNGNGNSHAWCEFGNIDHEGHDRGWKLSKHLENMLSEIQDRIIRLLENGWKNVRIVTDHGWLLLPGGLPKTDLPSVLADSKWGRCASIKPGATTSERLYPWYWNTNQYFALADGISCFRNNMEYAHGGLSLQECLTLELNVSSGISKASAVSVEFTDIVWNGLRCYVTVDGEFSDLRLDIRTQPGDSSSSVILSVKPLKDNGTASVVVEKEELEGVSATIVLLNSNGELVAQTDTVIGGGKE
ncbi:MAG: BREX-1 system phosphatase PglZ type B [Methanosarcina sp.]|uniref:BREX-1 system phosphatase PglZ type B n=1 Tax=Methanosarcina sp. TaxID=2213 RepID=UPI0026067388|nr:BREX-1 system phosphatase PglZ type B [Methanosarcina sp.]MDD3247487.1 BREX-1 system phosphatase PglZ type B [Methanosarcina sp.]